MQEFFRHPLHVIKIVPGYPANKGRVRPNTPNARTNCSPCKFFIMATWP